jgi:hypothetical protein
VVVHAFNPSTWEAEAGGLWALGQLEVYRVLSKDREKERDREKKEEEGEGIRRRKGGRERKEEERRRKRKKPGRKYTGSNT